MLFQRTLKKETKVMDNRVVKIKYQGKTSPFVLTMPQLSQHYTFSEDGGMVAIVAYADAKILLGEFSNSFQVASGVFDVPGSFGYDPVPPAEEVMPADAMTDPAPEVIAEGDGVEGVGPMPPIEEEGQNPPPIVDQIPPRKTGRKK